MTKDSFLDISGILNEDLQYGKLLQDGSVRGFIQW